MVRLCSALAGMLSANAPQLKLSAAEPGPLLLFRQMTQAGQSAASLLCSGRHLQVLQTVLQTVAQLPACSAVQLGGCCQPTNTSH
jgi:hypothetical protein